MAEARQFYLEDSGGGGDSGEVWSGTTLEHHFGAVPGLVVVGTATQDVIPVAIEVWDGEPPDDSDQHDHVGETSLEVKSGVLVISECQGNPRLTEIPVDRGWYRVRSAADDLDTGEADDHIDSYRCQVWPAPQVPDRVLRWYEPWAPGPPPVNPHGLRVMTGAKAWDERLKMRSIGSRSLPNRLTAHLFQDSEGAYWEYGWHGKHFGDLIEIPASEVPQYAPLPKPGR